MTPIADMVAKMIDKGVEPEVILLAIRTAELAAFAGKSGGSPVDTAAEKRRAYDRERKAIERMSGGKSGGSPPDNSNSPSSLRDEYQNSQKEKEEAKPRRQSGRTLPEDWHPTAEHYADGAAMHRTREQVDAKADEMRLWARANAHRAVARKMDWDATFGGWMRRDWGTNGTGTRQNGTHQGTRPRQTAHDAIVAGMAAALAEHPESRFAGREMDAPTRKPSTDFGSAEPDLLAHRTITSG